MIKTISMQAIPPRQPHAIPTTRASRRRTLGLFVAPVIGMAILAAVLIGHRMAQAAPAGRTAVLAPQQASVQLPGSPAAMRAAVQALAAFPDPYPVAAGMAP